MAVPSTVVPSWKVTVPVGTALEEAVVTVAVKMTVWPATAGLAEATSEVAVGAAVKAAAIVSLKLLLELAARVDVPA